MSSKTALPDIARIMLSVFCWIKTCGDLMHEYKSITTVEYIRGVKNLGWQPFNKKVWQRDYYEHIIRDERAYINISNYIINNPANWKGDKFNK